MLRVPERHASLASVESRGGEVLEKNGVEERSSASGTRRRGDAETQRGIDRAEGLLLPRGVDGAFDGFDPRLRADRLGRHEGSYQDKRRIGREGWSVEARRRSGSRLDDDGRFDDDRGRGAWIRRVRGARCGREGDEPSQSNRDEECGEPQPRKTRGDDDRRATEDSAPTELDRAGAVVPRRARGARPGDVEVGEGVVAVPAANGVAVGSKREFQSGRHAVTT